GDRDFVDAHPPECVVVIGRPTLSRPVSALVRRPDVRLVVVDSGTHWSVPGRAIDRVPWSVIVVPSVPGGLGTPLATPNPPMRPDDTGSAADHWRETWLDRGAAIEASLLVDPPEWPTGAAIARTLGTALPADALLFVGSSNAPRDLDAALGPRAGRLDIVANRGLAGIDGCVSTAIGLALAEPERPAYALMGDLTFLHDTNGLLIGPDEPRPNLTIVVVNDDGGGIFHVLEPGEPERAEDFERLFGTPTGADLEVLCRAHGIRHSLAATAEGLAKTVAAQPDGISVVEIFADRSVRRADADELRTR
ncbi:MAG: thiamine pyrophosphate-dependent enzyme, partial [Nostocoides sp.]